MKTLFRSISFAALIALSLAACKSDSGKPQASATPADKPAASQSAPIPQGPTNSQQKVASGEYSVLTTPQPTEQGDKVVSFLLPHPIAIDLRPIVERHPPPPGRPPPGLQEKDRNAHPRHDDQLPGGQGEVEAAQVVRTGAADDDVADSRSRSLRHEGRL